MHGLFSTNYRALGDICRAMIANLVTKFDRRGSPVDRLLFCRPLPHRACSCCAQNNHCGNQNAICASALRIAAIQPALTEDGLANEPWIDKVAERLLTSFECYAGALRAKRYAEGTLFEMHSVMAHLHTVISPSGGQRFTAKR
jgi:hypothetical protein